MQLDKLFKEGKQALESLEYFDKTGKLPVGKKRIDITLDRKIIKKLKERSEKTGRPISRIIEEKLKSL